MTAADAPTNATPRASVVMTVYRDFRFLDEAVDSVLAQDFPDLELIIVDDGNERDDIFAVLAARDSRIRIVTSKANGGAAVAANLGIAAARSAIILRLDADDVCEPARVRRQVAALDSDPELVLVGSDVQTISETGAYQKIARMPRSDLEIRWTILFHNPLYHSAAAYRRSAFDAVGGYRPHEFVSQDHYMWFELLAVGKACNLPEPLVRYRVNSQGLTVQNNVRPRLRTHAIREKLWADIGLTYDLYDDVLAGDVTRFIRGAALPAARQPAAYAVIRMALDAFLAGPEARRDAETVAEGARIRAALEARMQLTPGKS